MVPMRDFETVEAFHEPRFRNAAFRLQNHRHFNALQPEGCVPIAHPVHGPKARQQAVEPFHEPLRSRRSSQRRGAASKGAPTFLPAWALARDWRRQKCLRELYALDHLSSSEVENMDATIQGVNPAGRKLDRAGAELEGQTPPQARADSRKPERRFVAGFLGLPSLKAGYKPALRKRLWCVQAFLNQP